MENEYEPFSAIRAATKTSEAAFFPKFNILAVHIQYKQRSVEKRTFSAEHKKCAMPHTQNDSRTSTSSVYLRGRVSGISTFSFSKSPDGVPPTSRHPNVYTASHWVQNWKQNWNCPPFRFFMIETSFTLFFLRKTTKKSKFSPRRAKKNI